MSVQRSATIFSFAELRAKRYFSSPEFVAFSKVSMELVEDVAKYLDGKGRQDAKRLDRDAQLVYATESMKLTTRLITLASWILAYRAIGEGTGEIPISRGDKAKLDTLFADSELARVALLPEALKQLIFRTNRFAAAVKKLDDSYFSGT